MTVLDPLSTWFAAAMAGLGAMLGPVPSEPPALSGYADADYVRIAPELTGRLVTLSVARGSRVAAGDLLFEQDDTADRAALAQARAQAATARAQLDNLLTGRRPAEVDVVVAQLHEAEAQARLAERQLARRASLAATKVASLQDLDIAQADLDAAQARVRSLSAQVDVARLPARPDEVKAAEAQVTASQAAVDQAEWRLAQRRVTAPKAARVDDVLHWPGEDVTADAPVVSLLPPDAIKVRVYVPEPRIGGLKTGQRVGLVCDGCPPGLVGHISFIASQAEYTPPVIYSLGNREKLVFLVEVRPDSDPEALHPGQPVDVTLSAPGPQP
jgi:HlyD family secretion protein